MPHCNASGLPPALLQFATCDSLEAQHSSGFSPMDDAEHLKDGCGSNSGWGSTMQPRQIVRAVSFGPEDLKVIFTAFDNAWTEIAPSIGTDPMMVEAARSSLATIVLGVANADAIAPNGLTMMAVAVFCAKHRIEARN